MVKSKRKFAVSLSPKFSAIVEVISNGILKQNHTKKITRRSGDAIIHPIAFNAFIIPTLSLVV
jgi:hypothetical protein